MAIPIALVEDNMVNRTTFIRKMESFDDLQMVFTAYNGKDSLEQLKELEESKRPRVIFVDLEMPLMNGIQFIEIAKALYPDLFFIVLTIFDDEENIFEAIKAGAHGYLLKDDSAIAIRNAITNSLELGGAPMSPPIARKALTLLSKSTQPEAGKKPIEGALNGLLSEREKEILQYMVKGETPKQIADALFISLLTVRKHIANIYEKLHVNSNTQVIRLAHKNHWV